MKIFPLRPVSNYDKFMNLVQIIAEMPAPKPHINYPQPAKITNESSQVRELRTIYRNAIKQIKGYCKKS